MVKVNHKRPKSAIRDQRVPLVFTMNHSVLFGSLWCFGSGIFGWCFGTLWSLVASLAGVLVHLSLVAPLAGVLVHFGHWWH